MKESEILHQSQMYNFQLLNARSGSSGTAAAHHHLYFKETMVQNPSYESHEGNGALLGQSPYTVFYDQDFYLKAHYFDMYHGRFLPSHDFSQGFCAPSSEPIANRNPYQIRSIFKSNQAYESMFSQFVDPKVLLQPLPRLKRRHSTSDIQSDDGPSGSLFASSKTKAPSLSSKLLPFGDSIISNQTDSASTSELSLNKRCKASDNMCRVTLEKARRFKIQAAFNELQDSVPSVRCLKVSRVVLLNEGMMLFDLITYSCTL